MQRRRGLLIGALVGAILGVALAWAVLGHSHDDTEPIRIEAGPGDWFKLGISALGIARQLGELVQRG